MSSEQQRLPESLGLPETDGLLIVAPVLDTAVPSFAAHALQASLRASGRSVAVLYANVLFAAWIGHENFLAIHRANANVILGERLFSRAAFAVPPLGWDGEAFVEAAQSPHGRVSRDERRLLETCDDDGSLAGLVDGGSFPTAEQLFEWEREALAFCAALAERIAAGGYRWVGASSTFEQTCASFALLGRIKALRPETTTILGGLNCDGARADALRALPGGPDIIVSGEGEVVLPDLIARIERREEVPGLVRAGDPVELETVPPPEYAEYWAQSRSFLGDDVVDRVFPTMASSWYDRVPYESSRGCWWTRAAHCSFCATTGLDTAYRVKSPDKVVEELRRLLAASPRRDVLMLDNIMPHEYFRSLVPRLAAELPSGTKIFYEQKSNITLEKMLALRAAGIDQIQPGIESLSTHILELMRKGVKARQNIATLRFARIAGVGITWNFIVNLPGDLREDYVQMLALMPLVRHLDPPIDIATLLLLRGSPYLNDPDAYGIRNPTPLAGYVAVLPKQADAAGVSYCFEAEYESGGRDSPDLIAAMWRELERWQAAWRRPPADRPRLHVTPAPSGRWFLADQRGLAGAPILSRLDEDRARLVLYGGRARTGWADWAIARRYCVELDGRLVPLATAAPEVMLALQPKSASTPRAPSLPIVQVSS